ncbi:MAG: GNAT family N-acetyltransferase [Bacillus sp. (in: firmicutes)]
MKIEPKERNADTFHYIVRSALEKDAKQLSEVRLQIDGETENLDREQGEAYIDESGFKLLIKNDSESRNCLFLVADVDGKIVGFSRCVGNDLKRTSHRVEFGICILKDYWGYGIGQVLLKESLRWADSNGIKKVVLSVLESNKRAISMYKKYGFVVEGYLKKDKLLSDGKYYDTILMGRFLE